MNNRAVTRVNHHVDEAISLLNKGCDVDDFPDVLKKQIKHWSAANALLIDKGHKGKKFVSQLLMMQFPDEIKRMSDAYLVMSCAEEFFVKYSRVNREAERIYAIERLKRQISKAEKDEDYSAVARLEAVMFKYLNPADDPIDAPDWKAIANGITIQPVYNPEIIDITPVPKDQKLAMYNNFMKRLKAKEEDFSEPTNE
jgi:hypothetical protein